MNGFLKVWAAVLLIGVLQGCGENKGDAPEAVQTVEWYKANQPERLAMLERCKNSPGTVGLTPNCINAQAADTRSRLSSNKGFTPPAPLKPN